MGVDFPLKIWQRGGILAQHIFKYSWMRAMERRPKKEPLRPVFLWGDEYQLFISSYDNEFSSTARSSRVCTVYLTQSVPALKDAVKGTAAKDTVDTLLNNFQTRIIHTCLDDVTQKWASDTIGKGLQWRYSEQKNSSTNEGEGEAEGETTGAGEGIAKHANGGGRNLSSSEGRNRGRSKSKGRVAGEGASRQQVMDYYLQPAFFASSLRMGDKVNKFIVDGVVLVGGKTWEYTGKPFLIASFSQK
jgi:hypothetical protein